MKGYIYILFLMSVASVCHVSSQCIRQANSRQIAGFSNQCANLCSRTWKDNGWKRCCEDRGYPNQGSHGMQCKNSGCTGWFCRDIGDCCTHFMPCSEARWNEGKMPCRDDFDDSSEESQEKTVAPPRKKPTTRRPRTTTMYYTKKGSGGAGGMGGYSSKKSLFILIFAITCYFKILFISSFLPQF